MYYMISLLFFWLLFTPPSSSQEPSDTTIYTVVEEMPFLKSCEDSSETHREKKACSDRKILSYFFNNITLDSTETYNCECCRSIVSFVINQDGKVQDVKVIKSINEGFDARMVKLVENLPEWIPGRQRGQNVSVKIVLPMRIRLNTK